MSARDIAARLRAVKDPELGIDVVSLGLVYGIDDEGDCMRVLMTMTSPGCPMGEVLVGSVEQALEFARPESDIAVDVTFEPAWNPKMMTIEAMLQLGLR
jgi:metal-sulfur cluster biosynthetic enzyme